MEKNYINLLDESFPGIRDVIIRRKALGFSWEASKLFIKQEQGNILSHVALLECPMLIEGKWHKIGVLHGICTHSAHRGCGLAMELIREALQWAKGRYEIVQGL
ncbi:MULTISPECIES: GNAT family N-acetyltransferase [Parachlamydia]|jgi:GNAT superfamily N-acetyltransferase|uniref:GNAT family N-acetyltransferase n=1 Tax=Parachlamydia TaxID=83551 RepID=UPI0001C17B81|nr:GNAT family N-acetyltransferase [Parachlamydia acanthamoebae]EFB42374.1 hypothetical protein pah_c009o005 [Parachlamydia acanthamoebae str. Hall's coccus]